MLILEVIKKLIRVIKLNFKEALELLDKEELIISNDKDNSSFSYLSYNSKDVNVDTLFICKGKNFKEEYLDEAIEKGATAYISEIDYNKNISKIIVKDIRKAMAIISNYFYDIKDKKCKIIGVTGTSGKTTTVNFIKDIVNNHTKSKNIYLSTVSSYNGLKEMKYKNTTPEIIDIDRCIKNANTLSISYIIMEVSSQAVKLDRIYGIDFDIGVLTNIDNDHISEMEHKDFNEYLKCKIDFLRRCKTIIICKDFPYYEEVIKELLDKRIITYGEKDADYIIKEIKKEKTYTSFNIVNNNTIGNYTITMKGKFNVYNATASIIVANILGIKPNIIKESLQRTKVLGRVNIFENFICPIIVDYAHNKKSLISLVEMVKEYYGNRNIKMVFGSTGDRGINRIDELGEVAGIYASYVYLTTDDPGPKEVLDICFDIAKNIKKHETNYEIIIDRKAAIEKALSEATKEDAILIIGKGDETYQKIKGVSEYYEGDINIVNSYVNNLNRK